jgi:hypothetical protein
MVLVSQATPQDCRSAASRRKDAAARYRPDRIRLLIIAQMPPDDLDRYFYFESVPTTDYLFQAVIPHLLGEEPQRLDKRAQLTALRKRGVFVIDLKSDPCDPTPLDSYVDDLAHRATDLRPKRAILVKVDVYDAPTPPCGSRRSGRRRPTPLPEHRAADRVRRRVQEGARRRWYAQPGSSGGLKRSMPLMNR